MVHSFPKAVCIGFMPVHVLQKNPDLFLRREEGNPDNYISHINNVW